MTTQAIVFPGIAHRERVAPIATSFERSESTAVSRAPLDLAGAAVHFEDATLGLVPMWFFDATPRRFATVIVLSRHAWRDARVTADVEARVGRLQSEGVAVLLVDARRRAWRRSAEAAFVDAATAYLEERRFGADDIAIQRAG